MTKKIILIALATVAFSGMSYADNALISKTGVLHTVDFSERTLSIKDEQGNIQAFNFSHKTRTIVDGRLMNLRRVLKPGQEVEIKFRANNFEQASL